MAANKFATMLHRNTNKITLILVYVILEWLLIFFLLLNSLFSYLIVKFADYFGLKRPCLWCSRLDHIFDHTKNKSFYRDLVCDAHAYEISKLGYCQNHKQLAESRDMCEDCSSSMMLNHCKEIFTIKMMKADEDDDKVIEKAEENSICSCCEAVIEDKFASPYLLIKPSWDALNGTEKWNLIEETAEDVEMNDGISKLAEISILSDVDETTDTKKLEAGEKNDGICRFMDISMLSDAEEDANSEELEADEEDKVNVGSETEQGWANFPNELKKELSFNENMIEVPLLFPDTLRLDRSLNVSDKFDYRPCPAGHQFTPNLLDNILDFDHPQLIPVDLIHFGTSETPNVDKEEASHQQETDFEFEIDLNREVESVIENKAEHTYELVENMDTGENEDYPISYTKEGDLVMEVCGKVSSARPTQPPPTIEEVDEEEEEEEEEEDEQESHVCPVIEVSEVLMDETERQMVMETKMLDEEPANEDPTQAVASLPQCAPEDPTPSSYKLQEELDEGVEREDGTLVEYKSISIKPVRDNILPECSELNEIEEEKIPETPTSIEGLNSLHKNLLLFEKRESGTDESVDGSFISEFEIGDGVLNIEKVKTILRSERKALNALYAELEKERSASAVAANQTMAMINRLQEEKAAMQMEALQYQRMMEEQTEYDQEALELMNELIVKREKEKQELEKELEVYRKKIMDYEARERFMSMRRRKEESMRSGNSSLSCSNTGDSDGLSIDLNHEAKESDGFYSNDDNGHHNTPVDEVLDESLAHFEEERQSILEQLKVLEEKLFTLDEEEDQELADIKLNGHLSEENGNGSHESSHFSNEADGAGNGYHNEMNGNHHQERSLVNVKAKRLLPLFDAIGEEVEDGQVHGHDLISQYNSFVPYPEQDYKKLAMQEEVDHVYERLRALEADWEFLRHCISSLNKGDKGIDLLQEILQHLRDLKSADLQVRNMGDV